MKIKATILILIIFGIDAITGNLHYLTDKAYPEGVSYCDNIDIFLRNEKLYNAAKSFFDWIPYLLVLLIARYKIVFDKYSMPVLIVMLFFCLLTTLDWFTNSNWRAEKLDWIVLFSVLSIIYFYKKYFK